MNGGQALQGVLGEALAQNAKVHLLGEALELSPATHGLLERHPERVHLLPAVDSALTGIAVGMALGGARPVVELAGPQSLHGAIQQLGQEAASATGEFSAPVILRVPVAPGEVLPLSLLLAIPGVTLGVASSALEARDLLVDALGASGPVVLLEPRWLLDRPVKEAERLPLGTARIVRSGDHCSLVCWGEGVRAAREAADLLSTEGIEAEVIDLRCLSPLDTELISESISRTGRAVFVSPFPGLFDMVLETAFLRLESPPLSCTARATSIVDAARQSVFY
jgi:pyruvate/2-oxoglutarate/acetoin dehydrogenase E1 component